MRELVRILDAIKKQIDAIAKHTKACEKSNEPPNPAIGPIEVQFLPEVVDKYYAEQDKTYRLQRRTFWVGLLTLIALAIYTCITYHQWRTMLDSNQINRDALQSVQRAFVSLQILNAERAFGRSDTTEHIWYIVPMVKNTGTTPAEQVVSYNAFEESAGEPDGRTFMGDAAQTSAYYIGPQTEKGLGRVGKKEADIFGHELGDGQTTRLGSIFVWGWMTYRDVFGGTKPHLTEFCSKVTNAKVLADNKTWILILDDCKKHNCVDEYCPDYQALIASSQPN